MLKEATRFTFHFPFSNSDRNWRAGLLQNRHFPGTGIDWGFM